LRGVAANPLDGRTAAIAIACPPACHRAEERHFARITAGEIFRPNPPGCADPHALRDASG